tara:strand:- start:20 stop:250 length:231 start_codon:yes stop_codon:yes gene_type:complete
MKNREHYIESILDIFNLKNDSKNMLDQIEIKDVIDSLAALEIVSFLKDEDIDISIETLYKFKKVNEIIDYMIRYKK